MAYRADEDLEFLRTLKSKDLDELYNVLTKDKDGQERFTEELTNNDLVKRFYPDHAQYIELIMAELQHFGGNSFVNVFRGGGVLYKEILCDVCDKLKVNYNKQSSTEQIELNMFMKLVADSISKMSQDELREFAKDLKVSQLNTSNVIAATQAVMKLGGFKTYQLILIIVNALWKTLFGRGLALATNAAITRYTAMFLGPIGWIITGLWTAIDLAGPAYRVTMPAVIYVAYLRQLSMQDKNDIATLE